MASRGPRSAIVGLLTFAGGCGLDERAVRLGDAEVLYQGEPYGDFVVLADAVRDCMQSDQPGLPELVLVDRMVECYTADGWQQVLGCEAVGSVVVVAPVVERSEGALWSHELTHYFGARVEDHPCGTLSLQDFSLEPPDATP